MMKTSRTGNPRGGVSPPDLKGQGEGAVWDPQEGHSHPQECGLRKNTAATKTTSGREGAPLLSSHLPEPLVA